MGKLDGKIALVTGAGRGIGKAVAQLFATEGAKVVCADRTLDEDKPVVAEGEPYLGGSLNATVSEIQKAGGTALAVQADVSDEENCIRLVETAKQVFGPVDVLVNNAVLIYLLPVKDFPIKWWIHTFAVNVHGPFMLSHLVLPDMIKRHRGAIINVSSGAAVGPGRGPYRVPSSGRSSNPRMASITEYGSAKAALERFTQGLAQEVYQYGISVTCVAPSLVVPTPHALYRNLASNRDDPQGEPPELMAKAFLLLATEPLDKVTGRVGYSQAILKEFGWIDEGHGFGIDMKGSGYSQQ